MSDLMTPLVKVRDLRCSPEAAFTLFTDRIGSWWPTQTHSVAGDRVASVVVEPLVGGRVYETDVDGVRHDWATVLAHDPPHRLVLDWYPGHTPADATRVEVTFTAIDTGCRLRLEHSGWPEQHREMKRSYDAGWELVLGRIPA